MREVLIKLQLSEEEAALFEGRTAMIVPLSDKEVVQLREDINGVDRFLQFTQKCLRTLEQVLESPGERRGQIERTLEQMAGPAGSAGEIHDHTRTLLGRAVFVGPDEERTLQ